jgi:hypothetical protein
MQMGSTPSETRVGIIGQQKITSVLIRTFRAINEPGLSMLFAQGHADVLKNHKIKKVVSANTEWIQDPSVVVILATSPEGTRIYGGARIHVHSEKSELPLQRPVRRFDPKIDDVINEMSPEGCAELCALWNSVEVAGLGIGSKLVINCAVSMCEQLGIRHLLALSSPVTRRWMPDFGFVNIESIGDKGGIPYPNERLIATVAHYVHPESEPLMGEEMREEMLRFRGNPLTVKSVSGPKGSVSVHFDLNVK